MISEFAAVARKMGRRSLPLKWGTGRQVARLVVFLFLGVHPGIGFELLRGPWAGLCTSQADERRHQWLLKESPSSILDKDVTLIALHEIVEGLQFLGDLPGKHFNQSGAGLKRRDDDKLLSPATMRHEIRRTGMLAHKL